MNYFSKNFSTARQALVKPCNRRPLVKPCKSSIVNRQSSIIVKPRLSSKVVNRQSSIVNACKGRFIYVVVGLWACGPVVGLRS
jgi:hypothetical protein